MKEDTQRTSILQGFGESQHSLKACARQAEASQIMTLRRTTRCHTRSLSVLEVCAEIIEAKIGISVQLSCMMKTKALHGSALHLKEDS